MRFFLDSEFLEGGPTQPLHLLSLGLVSADGGEYHGVVDDCPLEKANPWVRQHVLPFTDWSLRKPRTQVAQEVLDFVRQHAGTESPVFIADYGAYDWVVFCQLFGTMMDLPRDWPMFVLDLQQWARLLEYSGPWTPAKVPHNALSDALALKHDWEILQERARELCLPVL